MRVKLVKFTDSEEEVEALVVEDGELLRLDELLVDGELLVED
ncbi:MAG: hypothetical protein ACXAD7_24865 [Candidatus Kariarchaeaceae archaeon]|jgi:hypothetical protein